MSYRSSDTEACRVIQDDEILGIDELTTNFSSRLLADVTAITIATLHFEPDQALPVLVPYLVVFTVVSAIYLQLRKRQLTRQVSLAAPQVRP